MPGSLVFYTNPQSRGRIVRWMLEEIGAPYQTEPVEFGPAMKSGSFLAINPMGKVPAIRHEGTVVTETAAICAYLADAFPDARLAPPPAMRGPYYRWLFFAAGPLEAASSERARGIEPESARQRMMVGYGTFEAVMDTLEHAVSDREFIAGDRFSAADVYVGSHIGWGLRFGTIEARPALSEYWSRLSVREAYRRATEMDDALATGTGDPASA